MYFEIGGMTTQYNWSEPVLEQTSLLFCTMQIVIDYLGTVSPMPSQAMTGAKSPLQGFTGFWSQTLQVNEHSRRCKATNEDADL